MTAKKKTPGKKSFLKKIIIATAVLLLAAGIAAGMFYYYVFGPNTRLDADNFYLYIPTGASFTQVVDSLEKNKVLRNPNSFVKLAIQKGYSKKVKPGRYLITNNMSNNALVNLLRSGHQSPVNLTFNSVRTTPQLAGRLAAALETDSISLLRMLRDKSITRSYGFSPDNILLMFIPNTYEVYWNTPAEKLLERMHQEYKHFWTNEKKALADKAGLSPLETGILASIVEMETIKNDEKPVVAGVYINRLQRGIHLEADPTVIFALNDFTIKRVLKKHLAFPSAYNTYLNAGLPPGPIAMPSVSSLDAVLHYRHHDYLFFCAKPDLSGYHSFARNLPEHMNNARAYQKALDNMNIKR